MNGRTLTALRKLSNARKLIPLGSEWNHKKGGVYKVTGHALDTDSGEVRIVYQRIGGPEFDAEKEQGIPYARHLEEWTPDRFTPAHSLTQH
jgi:hypothetical protein